MPYRQTVNEPKVRKVRQVCIERVKFRKVKIAYSQKNHENATAM